MIYPSSFEAKTGFTDIRALLRSRCLSVLGVEMVDAMAFSDDSGVINERLSQVREFRRLTAAGDDFPLQHFFDVRAAVGRLRLEGTHMETEEMFDLRRSLATIAAIVTFLSGDNADLYPALHRLTDGISVFPDIIRRIDDIIDKFGNIRDDASPELAAIRRELRRTEGGISRTLCAILQSARNEGLVDRDTMPAMRDGRLVIPVAPAMKRRISGIVHDESASGKTIFIEPTEVVEANNRIRELENDQRREIIRILRGFADDIRPLIQPVMESYRLLADIDFIHAKALLAELINACEPVVSDRPLIDLIRAEHPLLRLQLEKQGKKAVPLDIELSTFNSQLSTLNSQLSTFNSLTESPIRLPEQELSTAGDHEGRPYTLNSQLSTLNSQLSTLNSQLSTLNSPTILIVSGPNAGGKSVCLKTVGLLQYMVQCGLSIPVSEHSHIGTFRSILIDIGDEQSIEDDLSTYSGHLYNMKMMMRHADNRTLLLIDEFGAGTEPQIGAAIAESILRQLCRRQTYAVITTHYQNLKHFADSNEGVVNGAMLYDRQALTPLFRLSIGRPGSSFAIEIARKIGLPEEVIRDASDIVGSDYIRSDKYLQDIVRDKRYWEAKRQDIHRQEKEMSRTRERYEQELSRLLGQRKDIIAEARRQAEELLAESNRRIEHTIREIKESQAEREDTRRIRRELDDFRQQIATGDTDDAGEEIERKMRQIERRRQRHAERRKERDGNARKTTAPQHDGGTATAAPSPPAVGSYVRIRGLTAVGLVTDIQGTRATVVYDGGMKTILPLERLEIADKPQQTTRKSRISNQDSRLSTLNSQLSTLNSRLSTEIDVRGMRGDEAVNAVTYFIDDATMAGLNQVRILHGTGTGTLRQLIRQYLATVPTVTAFRDEHVQFGGAGITVVELAY